MATSEITTTSGRYRVRIKLTHKMMTTFLLRRKGITRSTAPEIFRAIGVSTPMEPFLLKFLTLGYRTSFRAHIRDTQLMVRHTHRGRDHL